MSFEQDPRGRSRGGRSAVFLGACILTGVLSGVSGCYGPPRAAAVDAPRAREALRVALERWKNGGKAEDLKSGSPPITAQDLDWLAGFALVEYHVIDEGKYDDANLRIPVELTLRAPDGREVQKRVSYVVGTSPSVTVFREL